MKNIQNLNYDNLSNSLNNTARTRCRITKLDSRNFYSTNNSNISRDEWPVILGRKGDLLPAYRIANEYLNKGKHMLFFSRNKSTCQNPAKYNPCVTIVPAVIYTNAGVQKEQILEENRGKAGISRWTNLKNGNFYVGSAVDLSKRLYLYYNSYQLTKVNMVINKALNKHKHSNFTLEILEYCEKENVITREQYYLDLFAESPKYNILPIAGSSLGYKHSEETLIKMRERKHLEETKN